MDTKTMEKDNPATHSFFGVVLCGRLLELPTCQCLNLCWIQLIPLHLQFIFFQFDHGPLLRTLRHGYFMPPEPQNKPTTN